MKNSRGFTLIELMVVVVVIGILSAIAYPNYSDYVTRTRIGEAKNTLSEWRVRMEQYYQDRRTYIGACQAGTNAPVPVDSQGFQFSCPAASLLADSYVLRADGLGFRFEVDQTNARSTPVAPTGWQTSAACWVRDKSGGC